METLLTGIVTWLSIGFGLPATYAHPRVELVAPEKMNAIQIRARMPAHAQGRSAAQRNVVALYDDESRTLYLPEGWTGKTPAEVSILVHEMVHHLQNLGGLKFDCPQARERLAYAAQDQWLARSGQNLMDEFELDALTVLLRTKCMH